VVAWVGDPRREKRLDLAYATYEVLRQRRDDTDLRVVTKMPHEAIPNYLNAADVLLLTSDHEGSPVVIKEAMACNLPIVSTNVGDVSEVIGGVEGCFLAEHTAEDLADKVELALEFAAGGGSPGGTPRPGRRTRGREAIAHLQIEGEARAILALYEAVLARRGKPLPEGGAP
jgi:glycosyltransferase involved in cell wall biosynthesis